MKKPLIISSVLMALTMFNAAEAKEFKDVKSVGEGDGHCSLVEGSLAVLAEKAPMTLIFDFSNTNFGAYDRKNKQFKDTRPLPEYLAAKGEDTPENWPELVESIRNFSAEKIRKDKTYKLFIDNSNPKYEMRLVFDNINFGSTAETMTLRAFGIGGASFSGSLVVTEIATGKVALNLSVGHAYCVSSMGYHYTANKRLQCTVGDFFFGKYLPTVYKKNK